MILNSAERLGFTKHTSTIFGYNTHYMATVSNDIVAEKLDGSVKLTVFPFHIKAPYLPTSLG